MTLEILPSLLNSLGWEDSSSLVRIKLGFYISLPIPKFEGLLSVFSNFPENVLTCLLLVVLTSVPKETKFVLEDAHASNLILIELFLIQV